MNALTVVLAVAWVGGVAVLAATLYGLAALWAAAGRGDWLWRFAPITLLIAALAPIGAYDLVAMFGTQAALVIGGVALVRFVDRRRSGRLGWGQAQLAEPTQPFPPVRRAWPQFHLADVLKAVLLAAAVLAIVQYGDASEMAAIAGIVWWPWIVAGAALGAVTIAAAWLATRRRRWYVAATVFVLVTIVFGGILEGLEIPGGLINPVSILNAAAHLSGLGCVIAGLQCLLTAICLAVFRRAGWPWPLEQNTRPARRRRSVASRAALGVSALLAAGILAPMYWQLLPPARPPVEPLPNPNGYDDLVRAGTLLNWSALGGMDADEATVEACQAFVKDNARPLALMRQAFGKPCQYPINYADPYSSVALNNQSGFRDLCRALQAEGKAADGAGGSRQAVQSYLDMVRLAQRISYGGLVMDDLTADAIEGVGLEDLAKELPRLDATNLRILRRELENFEPLREPLQTVVERDYTFMRSTWGWAGRLFLAVNGFGVTDETLQSTRNRATVRLRLLVAETAVRQYVLAEGAPPESLTGLVPEYLSAMPLDPYRDAPLVYRRTPDGYLLYSVGNNGVDDGGQRVSFPAATTEGKGDLFFDSPYEMPGDAPDKMPGPSEEAPAGAGGTATPPQCLWFSSKILASYAPVSVHSLRGPE